MNNNSYSLNGEWEIGAKGMYGKTAPVPGLAAEARFMNDGDLWYKKEVSLPGGDWSYATVLLKGARFCPSIFVNGRMVSSSEGGMTITRHVLQSPDVKPNASVRLEIALKSLKDVKTTDASRIPEADHWRSNISSCLWDDVFLKFHGAFRINRIIPTADLIHDRLRIKWEVEHLLNQHDQTITLCLQILNESEDILKETVLTDTALAGEINWDLEQACKPWSPEAPNCYKLRITAWKDQTFQDCDELTLGLKEFSVSGIQFQLNHKPVTLRAGTVVWHRWLRDPESTALAFDDKWFEENVVLRLKEHGANTLRFHLGMPPERFLDLCDRYGLLVQAEWSYFHGMKGSKESLMEQWRNWLDMCMRHPCIGIVHPWNETEGEELKTAYSAIEELLPEYPPLVIGHKDVIHIHKYWWSLFENVGLFYDSASQFDKPIMVDEFGGNYLDGDGNPGAYPTVNESLLRFLGYEHTKEMRLALHRDANARIAEYWRRIGAAGFSPFCILGSPEDGSHHFMGPLRNGDPKPVWSALTAAYSPRSCSLNIWDRNYTPGQSMVLPVHFFNDTDEACELKANITISSVEEPENPVSSIVASCWIGSYTQEVQHIAVRLPEREGDWVFRAELLNPSDTVKYPVRSEWQFRTMSIRLSEALVNKKIAVPAWEPELRDFLEGLGICTVDLYEPGIHVLVGSKSTWKKLEEDEALRTLFRELIHNGCSVVALDAGPTDLFLPGHELALEGLYRAGSYEVKEYELFNGITVRFRQVPEPESCFHPAESGSQLWEHLHPQATSIWNGLRGGLNVPVWDMEVEGLGADDFLAMWTNRGADAGKMKEEDYYAYELAGCYAFSVGSDSYTMDQLREKVRFLVEDAPALKNSIDPDAPIKTISLSALYKASSGQVKGMKILARCGKNLTRTPVIELTFGENSGSFIVSQIITRGRLAEGHGEDGLYGVRKDPAAGQLVLNLLKKVVLQFGN